MTMDQWQAKCQVRRDVACAQVVSGDERTSYIGGEG